MNEELLDPAFEIDGQRVKDWLEISPHQRPVVQHKHKPCLPKAQKKVGRASIFFCHFRDCGNH